MKHKPLLLAFITLILFPTFSSGVKPKETSPNNLAVNMVNKLCKYVDLADTQKQIIQASANEYEHQVKTVLANKSIKNREAVLNIELQKYRAIVDSVLLEEQKDTIRVRFARELKADVDSNKK